MSKAAETEILAALSEYQIRSLIENEAEELQNELQSGIEPTFRKVKRKEIIHRGEQIVRLAELLPT